MAELQELLQQRYNRLETIPEAFATAADKQQQMLMANLTRAMTTMETSGGKLVLNEQNIERMTEIVNGLIDQDLMRGEYGEALRDYLQEFEIQGDINDQMFAAIVDDLTLDSNWRLTIQAAQRTTLANLGINGLNVQLAEPLRQQLMTSMTNGATIDEATKALQVFIEGNDEVLPRLTRHARQVAFDAFAFSDRTYSHTVSTGLGFEWYRYQGGLIKDSREFCIERVGKIYHKSEIEAWANLRWRGKTQNTNQDSIYSYLGGYNCQHGLTPIIEEDVPESVKARIQQPAE